MFASITYIETRHPAVSIQNQVDQHTSLTSSTNNNASSDAPQVEYDPENRHNPEPSSQRFHETMRELAQDLVLKQAQIEALIESLPGLGNSRAQQEKRIEELEAELRDVDVEREKARKEKEQLLRMVEGRIVAARRA
jgi:mediator of RNA polymerase II transcription subunit 21